MKKILVVGDSYAYGEGCIDRQNNRNDWDLRPSEHCWANLIQNYFNIPVTNLSLYGIDNLSIFAKIKNCNYKDYDLIIFAGTHECRIQVCDPLDQNATRTILANFNPNWSVPNSNLYNQAHLSYFKYFYSELIGTNISIASILAAYSLTQMTRAKFLFSLPQGITDVLLTDLDKFRFTACYDFPYTKNQLALCRHPNELGQNAYFESVIKPLIQNLL